MAKNDYSRYTIALIIIAVFVFIFLTIVAIRLFGTPVTTLRRFPPWLSECPDFWMKQGNKCVPDPDNPNGRQVCNNEPGNMNPNVNWTVPRNLQYSLHDGVDFSQTPLNERCQWAQACDVYWEGISDQACRNNDDYFQRYNGASME